MMKHPSQQNMFFIRNSRAPNGFTLVEAMVSIAILSVALLGPFYAAQQALTASATAKDQLTASMLAQEGIEYVRSIRDDNYLYISTNSGTTQTWLYGLDGTNQSGTANAIPTENCFTPNLCVVDPDQNIVRACTAASCLTFPLYINSTTYLYNQSTSGTQTSFVRTIQLTPISATEVKVVATVHWTYHTTPYSTSVTEYLDNWQ
jgi:prepilin-type N-terminal cleavage/methylation domain-containing protein